LGEVGAGRSEAFTHEDAIRRRDLPEAAENLSTKIEMVSMAVSIRA